VRIVGIDRMTVHRDDMLAHAPSGLRCRTADCDMRDGKRVFGRREAKPASIFQHRKGMTRGGRAKPHKTGRHIEYGVELADQRQSDIADRAGVTARKCALRTPGPNEQRTTRIGG